VNVTRTRIGFCALLLLTGTTTALAGCSTGEEGRQYALPETLCGLPVEQNLYQGLFPAGESVEITGDGIGDEYRTYSCGIHVDGERAAFIETSPTGGVDRVAAVYSRDVDLSAPEEVPGEYEARLWDGLGVASATCARGGEGGEDRAYSLAILVDHASGDESRDVLRELIQPAMGAALGRLSCGTAARPEE
jgi:hypothetical protein